MGVEKNECFCFGIMLQVLWKNDVLLLVPYRSITKGTICVGPSGPTPYLYLKQVGVFLSPS